MFSCFVLYLTALYLVLHLLFQSVDLSFFIFFIFLLIENRNLYIPLQLKGTHTFFIFYEQSYQGNIKRFRITLFSNIIELIHLFLSNKVLKKTLSCATLSSIKIASHRYTFKPFLTRFFYQYTFFLFHLYMYVVLAYQYITKRDFNEFEKFIIIYFFQKKIFFFIIWIKKGWLTFTLALIASFNHHHSNRPFLMVISIYI